MINLKFFSRTERYARYFSGVSALIFFFLGGYFVLSSPPDYQQGEFVRIMYVHVPSAWMALGIYVFMGVCSIVYVIWRNNFLDLLANQAALVGAVFAAVTLVTGALWGKPVWGAWWVWDARLTSMLILFFFYLGYIALLNAVREDSMKNDAPAILAIIGLVNIPIVKFSVNMWSTLHQPAGIVKSGGPSVHSSMMLPLVLMFCACVSFFVFILIFRVNAAIIRKKILRIKHISST